MRDRERRQLETLSRSSWPGLTSLNLQFHHGLGVTQHDLVDQILHPIQGGASAVNLNSSSDFPAHQRAEQPGQPQDVIEVPVGQQDAYRAV